VPLSLCFVPYCRVERKEGDNCVIFEEITNLVQSTEDHGVLDHALANVIPSLRSLTDSKPSHLEPSSFTVPNKFAPAQKNEKQLKFTKLKTPGRKKFF